MPGKWAEHLRARLAAADRFDLLTTLLIAVLVALALATFGDYAISNDEEVQQRYGELIIDYYASGFTDVSLFGFRNLYLYGGLFDIATALLRRVLPFDPYDIRHVLSALIGIAGIGATAATARLIAGARAGFIAALALTVCGVWYGGMFNHTKDIPFAAAMIGAIYFLLRCLRDLPRPRTGDVIGLGLLLGAALGLRALALLVPCYAGLAVLVIALRLDGADVAQRLRFIAYSAPSLLAAFAIAYVFMVAAWPWAALHPLNPLRAVFSFAHFHYEIDTLLAGVSYKMHSVPRWYVPTYLLIKLPLLVLFGALMGLACMIWPRLAGGVQVRRGKLALVAFAAAFPVVCQVALHGPAFSGMRHFIFIAPLLAVLAGVGIDGVLRSLEGLGATVAALALSTVVAIFVWNAGVLVRLHPHEYLFFNPLVGGLEGASRRYDTDYWVNIIPEAVEGLKAYVDRTDKGIPGRADAHYTVGVCGERLSFENEAGSRFIWSGGWLEADFFIAPTHMNCDRMLKGKVAFTIERLGVVIGVVLDLRGLAASERGFQQVGVADQR